MKEIIQLLKNSHLLELVICFTILTILITNTESRQIIRASKLLEQIDGIKEGYGIKVSNSFKNIIESQVKREGTNNWDTAYVVDENSKAPRYIYTLNSLNQCKTVSEIVSFFSGKYYEYYYIYGEDFVSIVEKDSLLSGSCIPSKPRRLKIHFIDDFRNPGGLQQIDVPKFGTQFGIAMNTELIPDSISFSVYVLVGSYRVESKCPIRVKIPISKLRVKKDYELRDSLNQIFDLDNRIVNRLSDLNLLKDEIGNLSTKEAAIHLETKLKRVSGTFSPLSLSLGVNWMILVIPLFLLMTNLHRYILLTQLVRVTENLNEIDISWYPLFDFQIARITSYVSLAGIPVSTSLFLTWKVQDYWPSSSYLYLTVIAAFNIILIILGLMNVSKTQIISKKTVRAKH